MNPSFRSIRGKGEDGSRDDTNVGALVDASEVRGLSEIIAGERLKKNLLAVESIWRIGDAVRRLRDSTRARQWRITLESCAGCVGMHPGSLEEAMRASNAFPDPQRAPLLLRFERMGRLLTPSHVIELARTSARRRAAGIEALLRTPHSVRQLRECLRCRCCAGETSGDASRLRLEIACRRSARSQRPVTVTDSVTAPPSLLDSRIPVR